MNTKFAKDFRDFLEAFNNNNVEYLVVGGYSVIAHGYMRTTGDLDVWVNKTKTNYKKIKTAFNEFGMPVFDMTEKNFLSLKFDVFSFGVSPVNIDLITDLKGMTFKEAFPNKIHQKMGGVLIAILSREDLIKSKIASGRARDIDDIENLS
jgi:hypothetical protein